MNIVKVHDLASLMKTRLPAQPLVSYGLCLKHAILPVILVLILSFILQGCGTIRTLNPAGSHIEISHRGHKSYCRKIPRIYSGTAFDICKFYGEPNSTTEPGTVQADFQILFIDILLSFSLDTVVLPYTALQQYRQGNIFVNKARIMEGSEKQPFASDPMLY